MSVSAPAADKPRVMCGILPFGLGRAPRQQFLPIPPRGNRRWVIPKGWPKKGKSPQHSAAREAFEEAGVVGAVAKRPIGSFSYEKRLKNGAVVVCAVRVFALQVNRQSKRWPENQERVVKWLSAPQAAQRVKEPNLGEIIRRMARRYDGHQPALAARTRARTKIK